MSKFLGPLQWDVEAGAAIAEHTISPLAADILGSLYPDVYGIAGRYPEEYSAARQMRISDYIGRIQEVMREAVEAEGLEKQWEQVTQPYQSRGDFDLFLYNELKLEQDISDSIYGMPQADTSAMREVLRESEALVITTAYEDLYIFFVISREHPTRCFQIDSYGSHGVEHSRVMEQSTNAYERSTGLVTALYSRVNMAVNPILNYLGLHIEGYPIEKAPNVEEAIKALLGLLDAKPCAINRDSGLENLGELLAEYESILWATAFPLSQVPMHLLGRRSGGGTNICSYLPSGSILVGLRNIHMNDHRVSRALVFSNPTGDLASCDKEGDYVSSFLTNKGVEVVHKKRDQATRQFFVEYVSQFDIFHYCGHGYGDESQPLRPLLRLADGPLEVSDIVRAKPQLVFAYLNSCSSGMQKSGPYGELTAPANVFLSSGVASVFAPIILVRDNLAFAVSRCFYNHVENGCSVGQAAGMINHDKQTTGGDSHLIYRFYGLPETSLFVGNTQRS